MAGTNTIMTTTTSITTTTRTTTTITTTTTTTTTKTTTTKPRTIMTSVTTDSNQKRNANKIWQTDVPIKKNGHQQLESIVIFIPR